MVAKNSTIAQTAGRPVGDREDGLEREDIQQIFSVSLMGDHAPECSTEGGEIELTDEEEGSEAESDSPDEDEDNDHVDKLRHELEKAVPGGFRHR